MSAPEHDRIADGVRRIYDTYARPPLHVSYVGSTQDARSIQVHNPDGSVQRYTEEEAQDLRAQLGLRLAEANNHELPIDGGGSFEGVGF
jgi:hypothetical protein